MIDVHNNGQHEQVLAENVSVQASSSHVVVMEPTLQLVEGALDWWINLTGKFDPGSMRASIVSHSTIIGLAERSNVQLWDTPGAMEASLMFKATTPSSKQERPPE